MSERAGFSMVELILSIVVGGLILTAGMTLLVQQRMFYTSAADAAGAISSLNQLELKLAGEFLPINTSAGDLIYADADSMRMRLFRGVYSVCDVSLSPVALTVKRLTLGGEPIKGDSALVYSQGPTSQFQDDVWKPVRVNTVSDTTCPDNTAAWRLAIHGLNTTELGQLPAGAPLRVFGWASYWFRSQPDGFYLTRTDYDSNEVVIAGPLRQPGNASTPPAFRYFDANGLVTTVPSNVARLEVSANAVRFVVRGKDPTTASRTLTFRFRNN